MTLFRVFLTLFCVFTTNIRQCISLKPNCEKYIDYINKHQNTWIAGKFNTNIVLPDMETLMETRNETEGIKLRQLHHPEVIANLPENFDARDKWSNCPSLNEIRDQGHCGSCWAFGAVTAMTDRVCIYSNGTKNFHFSAEDLVSCAHYDKCYGCKGCPIHFPWIYWRDHGIVSGGCYHSRQGCRPYSILPTFEKGVDQPTPQCVPACEDNYNVKYENDKHFGKHVYNLLHEDQIKAEIYLNGPVEADFSVYEDFPCYKSGVYRHIIGDPTGLGHAIKILGWGVEKGTKYWLAANSWSPHWGEKGFFKFLRGENHCNIEKHMVAGEPIL